MLAGLTPTLDRTTDPNGKLLFTFRRTTNARNDTNRPIRIEYGSTLGPWAGAVHQGTGANQITITETSDTLGVEIVTVALPASLGTEGKLFVRLNASVATE